MLAKMDVRRLARGGMQELAEFSQGMVSLGMHDKFSMIYVENCRSQSALTLSLDVGSRIPLASTAMGRAYLAALPEAERQHWLQAIQQADPAAWARTEDGILSALGEHRDLGCCTSFGDWQKDVNAIAVAFHPGNGMAPMAINCGGPAFQLAPDFLLQEVRPRLLELVMGLRSALGA
jgi:DNA-binding IclR family transcriptional regulator